MNPFHYCLFTQLADQSITRNKHETVHVYMT